MYLKASRVGCVNWSPYVVLPMLEFLLCSIFVSRQSTKVPIINISCKGDGYYDRLCGLVVRVPGYRRQGPGFDSLRYQIFREVVGLERNPLSLVSTIE
jgi:hypothetical protein